MTCDSDLRFNLLTCHTASPVSTGIVSTLTETRTYFLRGSCELVLAPVVGTRASLEGETRGTEEMVSEVRGTRSMLMSSFDVWARGSMVGSSWYLVHSLPWPTASSLMPGSGSPWRLVRA